MKLGDKCSFFHEGGKGERRWVVGWRYGIIRAIPTKGQHKHWVQIEIPVRLYGWDDAKKHWFQKPFNRAWVHGSCVNEPGDTTFHGMRLTEEVKQRKRQKVADQAKADKATVKVRKTA